MLFAKECGSATEQDLGPGKTFQGKIVYGLLNKCASDSTDGYDAYAPSCYRPKDNPVVASITIVAFFSDHSLVAISIIDENQFRANLTTKTYFGRWVDINVRLAVKTASAIECFFKRWAIPGLFFFYFRLFCILIVQLLD